MSAQRTHRSGRAVSPALLRGARTIPTALIFLFPTLLILGLFKVFPAVYSLVLSVYEWDGLREDRVFVGLRNYGELFASTDFWNSLRVTAIYATGVTLIAMALGLIVAVMLNRAIRGRTVYRLLYFLPVITPTVAAGVIWKYLFDPSQGAINRFLSLLDIGGPAWLTAPEWALSAVIIVGVWKRIGFNMIVYLAALQSIPRSYYEAASIDGATGVSRFFGITLPLVASSTFFITVTSLIEAFQAFDLVYVMTGGGPLKATDVAGFFLYRHGFRYYELGYASAIAYVIFVVVFGVTLVQYAFRNEERTNG
jgi:multiple sugar transport system permease protein